MLECRICRLDALALPEGGPDEAPLCCPVCGTECVTVYTVKRTGQPLGCEGCISVYHAAECA